MSEINIQIKQRNGSLWDELFPKTKAELVIESTDKQFVSASDKTTWDGKQNALGFTPENSANKNVANGYAGLDGTGKVPSSILPAIAISDTFVVASQTAMLALTAEVGDVAVRTDLSKSFILKTAGASTLANWQELLTPNFTGVTSVNSRTGAVTLTATDVNLGNVTNESKTTMFTSPAFTGTPTAPTASVGTNTTQVATTAFATAVANTKTKVTVNSTEPTTPNNGDLWYAVV